MYRGSANMKKTPELPPRNVSSNIPVTITLGETAYTYDPQDDVIYATSPDTGTESPPAPLQQIETPSRFDSYTEKGTEALESSLAKLDALSLNTTHNKNEATRRMSSSSLNSTPSADSAATITPSKGQPIDRPLSSSAVSSPYDDLSAPGDKGKGKRTSSSQSPSVAPSSSCTPKLPSGPAPIIYILGWPGVGRTAVAAALVTRMTALHGLEIKIQHVPESAFYASVTVSKSDLTYVQECKRVREHCLDTLGRTEERRGTWYIFTDCRTNRPGSGGDETCLSFLKAARKQGRPFVPVVVDCDVEENIARFVKTETGARGPDVKGDDEKSKKVRKAVEQLRECREKEKLLYFLHPNQVKVDVKDVRKGDVAEEVGRHVERCLEGKGRGVGCVADTVEVVREWMGFEGMECRYRVGMSEMLNDGTKWMLWEKERDERKGG
ncbi:hypothetical protein LTS18_013518 [Coniosporium uncinatum]|uniref:Uncharacterized protein n=1 Tax=Coniosporium uncinatum TaxID=93489 RepID=A0ACC3DVP4_9PEZI|nr:hypothetical protein LTS18_013518 [Coniosporium uncinatum]